MSRYSNRLKLFHPGNGHGGFTNRTLMQKTDAKVREIGSSEPILFIGINDMTFLTSSLQDRPTAKMRSIILPIPFLTSWLSSC